MLMHDIKHDYTSSWSVFKSTRYCPETTSESNQLHDIVGYSEKCKILQLLAVPEVGVRGAQLSSFFNLIYVKKNKTQKYTIQTING